MQKSSPAFSNPGETDPELVDTVAQALASYEQSLADARSKALQLGLALLGAQRAKGLAAIAGRQIFAAVTASQGGLDTALTGSADAHRLVEAMARRLGMNPISYGGQKPPEEDYDFFTTGNKNTPAVQA